VLKRLLEKLKDLKIEPTPYDPSVLGDPIAERTGWGPAKGGGASFGTHKLVVVDSFRLEFRPTGGALAFYGVFLVVGVTVLVGMSIVGFSGVASSLDGGSALPFIIPTIVGLVFTVAGGGMLRSGSAPIVFDKRRGAYWRGRVAPHELSNRHGHKETTALDEIHALQLISERCTSKDSSYYSYELNLVRDDGTRINVVDHGNLDALHGDATALASFLEVPVWDAT
jgi:hypothetical protein